MAKPSTPPTDFQPRFLRSITFIEDNLFSPLALCDAAKEADFSPAYFSRLFRELTGEPFGAYVRARRMTVAAERLQSEGEELRLVDLAFDSGYDSQEAFTRAFKRTFGRTPGAFREEPIKWSAPFRRRLDAESLAHLHEKVSLEPEIRELESFTVVGLRDRVGEASKAQRIPALWGRIMSVVERIPNIASESGYGVSLNVDTEEGTFDYVAGVWVSKVGRLPAGVVAETIPTSTYAIFTHRVRSVPLTAELAPTYRWIFGTWFPSSPYEYLEAPDFERYPPGFRNDVPEGFLEICVPVRPRA